MASGAKTPVIGTYPWQRRRDYLLMIAAVAAADGSLPPEELELLHHWMEAFKISEKVRKEVLEVARHGLEALEPIEQRLSKTDLVFSLMLDMMGMAMVDGVLQDKEIILLGDVASRLRIDPIDFSILIEFVHSAHQASLLHNPEPLFEHNILSAFQLLHERKVRLFPHTLLCATSSTYDEQLKARWFAFKPR